MELKDYVRLLHRRWWILALCTLLGGLGAFVTTDREPTHYGSTMTFFLADASGRPVDPALAQTASTRLESYVTLASSGPVTERVREETGVAGFGAAAAPVAGTIFLRLDATAGTADDASRVAEAYASVFPEYVNDFEGGGATAPMLGVLEEPSPGVPALGPSLKRNLLLGLVLGLVVGAGIVVLLETLDTKIRDVDELERIDGDHRPGRGPVGAPR